MVYLSTWMVGFMGLHVGQLAMKIPFEKGL